VNIDHEKFESYWSSREKFCGLEIMEQHNLNSGNCSLGVKKHPKPYAEWGLLDFLIPIC